MNSANDGYIFSLRYDSLFIILPGLLLLALPGLSQNLIVNILPFTYFLFIGFVHEAVLWSLFTDSDWRGVARRHWIVFLAAPALLLVIISLVGVVGGQDHFRRLTHFLALWNYYHLVRQNIGIMSIYRHRSGHTADQSRQEFAIYALSAGLYLYGWADVQNLDFLYKDYPFLDGLLTKEVMDTIAYVGLLMASAGFAVAVVCLARMRELLQTGAAPRFFLIACLFGVPMGFFESKALAMTVILLIHYAQYIGLQMGVQFNKAIIAGHSRTYVRRAIIGMIAVTLIWAILRQVLFLMKMMPLPGYDSSTIIMWLAIFNVWGASTHYFTDRYAWRMAYPDVRANILPYLKGLTLKPELYRAN